MKVRVELRRGAGTVVAALLLAVAGAAIDLMTEQEFGEDFATRIRAKQPRAVVKLVGPLRVSVKVRELEESTISLTPAYETYRRAPDKLEAIVGPYVTSAVETLAGPGKLDPTKIVPVVKSRAWLDQAKAQPGGAGLVFDELNSLLVVAYAEDAPNSFAFLTLDDVDGAGIERAKLRQLAADNLVRMFPKIERRGEDGVYKVEVGGDYEASMLALGGVWQKESFDIKGEFVFAVPARGSLYVTGSEDAAGIDRVRGYARTEYRDSPYRMTPELFIRQGNKLDVLPGEKIPAPSR